MHPPKYTKASKQILIASCQINTVSSNVLKADITCKKKQKQNKKYFKCLEKA